MAEYNLPTDFVTIRRIPPLEWKQQVKQSIEKRHVERLIAECHKNVDGNLVAKKKTATIVPKVTDQSYHRTPQLSILNTSKRETRTIMMARYGLLECGKNFKGTIKELCDQCTCLDDENHRINYCIKWRSINLYDQPDKIPFDDVYSDNLATIRLVTAQIEKVWNTRTAHGTMRNDK